MKGVLVILGGIGDLPSDQLKGKTPLEAAEKPAIDFLAKNGEIGYMYPIKENISTESDTATLSLLGNDPRISLRGQLEALGAGIGAIRGDLALRTNFATIDNLEKGNVTDRRAGRTLTTSDAEILAKSINKQVKLPCKFFFKPTIQHRGILILKGGFSDNVSNTDPSYGEKGKFKPSDKLRFCQALDEKENTEYTANIVNMFISQSFQVLDKHPVNEQRRKKGMLPANILLTRDAGVEIPKLKQMKKWAGIVYMPLEIGIAKAAGMDVLDFEYPAFKDYDVYKNLHAGLEKAAKFAKKMLKKKCRKYDYFYIHFKETDVPGHDNKPHEKVKMIEELDKLFFSYLSKLAIKHKAKVVVTGDHSTPCKMKSHSGDPVPILVCDWHANQEIKFSEKEARKGRLGKIYGRELLDKIGFSR
ncbi:MAG: 2,3-bisphosphoglycerate-independent phosphoglycerate mutase [archaeon]